MKSHSPGLVHPLVMQLAVTLVVLSAMIVFSAPNWSLIAYAIQAGYVMVASNA